MAGPNMQKNVSLAGQSVKQGNYTVTYDERGYATKAVKDGGSSATSTVQTTHANDSEAHQKAYQAAQNGDWDAVGAAVNEIAYGGSNDPAKGYDFTEANAYMNELQDEFKYSANDYYQGKYDAVYGEGAWDGGTGTGKPTYPTSGSSVSGGGTGGSNSGISGGDYMSFDDFLAGTGYDKLSETTQEAIKAAVQNAINGYRDQIDTTNQDSDELARQAYIAKMLGQKNLDQQMAANGYAGGMADSQRIATETDYQNRLNEIEKMRLETVKELESAITNAQLTGDMQTAQELTDYLQTIQGQWMDYVQFQQSLDNQNYWNQQNLDAQNKESARSWAMQQMARGILPDDETLTAAGISKQAAQQQVDLVLSQNGGTVQQAVQQAVKKAAGGGYNNGSLTSSQVMQLQKALGVTADGMWGSNSQAAAGGMTADEAWAAYQGQTSGLPTFSRLMDQMSVILSEESKEAAAQNVQKLIDQYWNQMSTDQQLQVNDLLKRYGFMQ